MKSKAILSILLVGMISLTATATTSTLEKKQNTTAEAAFQLAQPVEVVFEYHAIATSDVVLTYDSQIALGNDVQSNVQIKITALDFVVDTSGFILMHRRLCNDKDDESEPKPGSKSDNTSVIAASYLQRPPNL